MSKRVPKAKEKENNDAYSKLHVHSDAQSFAGEQDGGEQVMGRDKGGNGVEGRGGGGGGAGGGRTEGGGKTPGDGGGAGVGGGSGGRSGRSRGLKEDDNDGGSHEDAQVIAVTGQNGACKKVKGSDERPAAKVSNGRTINGSGGSLVGEGIPGGSARQEGGGKDKVMEGSVGSCSLVEGEGTAGGGASRGGGGGGGGGGKDGAMEGIDGSFAVSTCFAVGGGTSGNDWETASGK